MSALTIENLREAVRVLEKGNTPGTPEYRERFGLWLKVLNGEAFYWYPPLEFTRKA